MPNFTPIDVQDPKTENRDFTKIRNVKRHVPCPIFTKFAVCTSFQDAYAVTGKVWFHRRVTGRVGSRKSRPVQSLPKCQNLPKNAVFGHWTPTQ